MNLSQEHKALIKEYEEVEQVSLTDWEIERLIKANKSLFTRRTHEQNTKNTA